MMSFSMLPLEIKIKIFRMLSIGSRYNASLVWEEMTAETWKSIPAVDQLITNLGLDDHQADNEWHRITNLDDLETAGVLASAGHLNSFKKLFIYDIDVSNIPVNIVNNLMKNGRGFLWLYKVRG